MIQSCVYKNLKESTKKPIKTNMSLARYKINIQKSIEYTVAMNKPNIKKTHIL